MFHKSLAPIVILLATSGISLAQDLIVAVGYGGRRMASSDGSEWTHITEWVPKGGDDSNNLISITYGEGKFVVAGGGGFAKESQKGHILVSTNGKDWTPSGEWPNRVNPVLFGNGMFLAAGGGHTGFLLSDDAIKWEKGGEVKTDGPGWAFWFRKGAFGNERFIIVGDHDTTNPRRNFCVVTKNGKSVESSDYDFPSVAGITFGNGIFVIATREDSRILTSKDGKEWKESTTIPGGKSNGVVFNGKHFIAGTGSAIHSSEDGIKWKEINGASAKGSLIAANGKTLIATNWPGKMLFSNDGGVTWENAEATGENGMNAAVFGSAKGKP